MTFLYILKMQEETKLFKIEAILTESFTKLYESTDVSENMRSSVIVPNLLFPAVVVVRKTVQRSKSHPHSTPFMDRQLMDRKYGFLYLKKLSKSMFQMKYGSQVSQGHSVVPNPNEFRPLCSFLILPVHGECCPKSWNNEVAFKILLKVLAQFLNPLP